VVIRNSSPNEFPGMVDSGFLRTKDAVQYLLCPNRRAGAMGVNVGSPFLEAFMVQCLGSRHLRLLPAFLVGALPLVAQEPENELAKRYRLDYSPFLYSQETPQDTLKSIVRVLVAGKVDYLLAHLADPAFVDLRVAEYKKLLKEKLREETATYLAFERLVRETTQHFQEDPGLLRELKLFAKEADWQLDNAKATGTMKSLPGKRVFLRKLEGRWFLEDRQQ
jgi:hypothetical protein